MESREIYDMLLRSVGEHMDTKGRAAVSINGRPALIVTIDRETGEITARNSFLQNMIKFNYTKKRQKTVAISTPALRRGIRRRTAAG